MITIKQLADEIGVSKVTVSNRIKRQGLTDRMTKRGNTYYLPDDLAADIRALFGEQTKQNHQNARTSAEESTENGEKRPDNADSLQRVIDVLAAQIEDLNAVISRMHDEQEKMLMLLHEQNKNYENACKMISGNAEPITAEVETVQAETPPENKRGLMGFIKSRNAKRKRKGLR